ncbi:unnamed protein product, partial [Sphacelaria rigidula]
KSGTNNTNGLEKTARWCSYHRSKTQDDADCRIQKESAAAGVVHYAHMAAYPSNAVIGAPAHQSQPTAGVTASGYPFAGGSEAVGTAVGGPSGQNGGFSFSAMAPSTL